jgi:anti-sigma factor RsiW
MNCVELQASLAEIDDGRNPEQRNHLKTCPACSALVTELILIASTAVELRAVDEPSPRVWKSIEATLRQEGVIRPQRANRSLLPSLSSRWGWARWVVPAAAALLITVGLYVRQHSLSEQLARNTAQPAAVPDMQIAGLNDDDLLQEIAQQSPALKAQYTDNLRRVNQYIQDAKNVIAANPNDDEARRSLLEAYQQKAMLFELAMDRSLP